MTKLTQGGLVALLLVAICLGWYSSVLSHHLDASRQEIMGLNVAVASREKAIDEFKRITGLC